MTLRALLLCAAAASTTHALAPTHAPPRALQRRHFVGAAAAAVLGGPARAAFADEAEDEAAKKAAEKAKKEALAAKIAASKTNYRRADTLYEQRKSVDYSCVSKTGSPCPAATEGPRSDGQLEDL